MDASHIPGIADPEQYHRHVYPDLLYLQRQYSRRHEHDYSHADCPGEHQAYDYRHYSDPGGWNRAFKLGHLCADKEQGDAGDHRRCWGRRLDDQFLQHHRRRAFLYTVLRDDRFPQHVRLHHIHREGLRQPWALVR